MAIAGEWDPQNQVPMSKQADGTFRAEVPLSTGRNYSYKFIVDGKEQLRHDLPWSFGAHGPVNIVTPTANDNDKPVQQSKDGDGYTAGVAAKNGGVDESSDVSGTAASSALGATGAAGGAGGVGVAGVAGAGAGAHGAGAAGAAGDEKHEAPEVSTAPVEQEKSTTEATAPSNVKETTPVQPDDNTTDAEKKKQAATGGGIAAGIAGAIGATVATISGYGGEDEKEVPAATTTSTGAAAAIPNASYTVPISTNVYSSETPNVRESGDHQLVSESVPITHARVSDIDAPVKAAPPITSMAALSSVTPASASVPDPERQTGVGALRVEQSGANVPTSEEVEPEVPYSVTKEETTVDAPKDTAATELADDKGTPLTQGVTGAASKDVTGVSASKESAGVTGKDTTSKVPELPSKESVTGAAGEKTTGTTSAKADPLKKTVDGAENTGTDATGTAKNTTSNTAQTGKDTVKEATEKPKKLGLVSKIKKTLHIGK